MCETLCGKYLVSIMLHYSFPLHTVVLYSYVHLFTFFIIIIYSSVFYTYGNQFISFMVILLMVIIIHIY